MNVYYIYIGYLIPLGALIIISIISVNNMHGKMMSQMYTLEV